MLTGVRAVSIVIPVCNMAGYTEICMDYLMRNTTVPYEVIFVDNASEDSTPRYLAELSKRIDVRVIKNECNLGPIVAANQGMREAKYDYICNMHNDVVIFERGWLERMVSAFERDGKAGLAGIAGRERVKEDGGADEKTLKHNLFFDDQEENVPPMREETAEAAVLDGMCIMTKKDVIDRIGFYDEAYGYMHFYDMDYSLRSLNAGFKNVVVNIRAMHIRNGGITRRSVYYKRFVRDDVGLYKKNSRIFRRKWGHMLPVGNGICG